MISFFSKVQIWVLRVKKFFFAVLGSVDSYIFANPDPGSQNLAGPTDPDPKHCTERNNGKIINHKNLLSKPKSELLKKESF